MKKVAVLIPCYNEELTIEKVIKDFKRELPYADIYVYDNNSKDKSSPKNISTKKSPKKPSGCTKASPHGANATWDACGV